MEEDNYICLHCYHSVELSTKPKRSFLGFAKIECNECEKDFQYPLSKGYLLFSWVIIIGNPAYLIY
jgi:hypothetical protein